MDDTSAAYDASAHTYDARYRDIQQGKYAYALSLSGSLEGDILDIGCGTGLFGEFLGKEIWGVDSSPGMLSHAGGRVRAMCADACDLPFDDDSFDWVVSFTVLQNIPRAELAIDEVVRVLRPSGSCILSYLNKPQFAFIGEAIERRFSVCATGAHSEDIFYFCKIR
jgi:ubiquinone/menaquinone biosynthesis C-methylase UbiE